MGERSLRKAEATGSTPVISTKTTDAQSPLHTGKPSVNRGFFFLGFSC